MNLQPNNLFNKKQALNKIIEIEETPLINEIVNWLNLIFLKTIP